MQTRSRMEKGIRIVDILDTLPEDLESIQDARGALANALGEGAEPVILHLHNLGGVTSNKLGLLIGAISASLGSRPDRVAFVSSDEDFAELFDVAVLSGPIFRHFTDEEEAISYLQQE